MLHNPNTSDIPWMVSLSYQKRLEYSKHQPLFWKIAKNSNEIQVKWFESELKNERVIALCDSQKRGFIIGKLVNPPEVYDSGLTLMIDDFCVQAPNLWQTVGKNLLEECVKSGKEKGAKQILCVCGDFDTEKYKLLENLKLTVASRWYVGNINLLDDKNENPE